VSHNHRDIADLRSALRFLEAIGDPPLHVARSIDPDSELAGVYAHFGAGTPTSFGMGNDRSVLFESAGSAAQQVLVGLFASRRRCARLLGCADEEIPRMILSAVQQPIPPVVTADPASCHERSLERVDLSRLPITTSTRGDAGPYITMGVVLASASDGMIGNISIHRLCVQSPDTLTIWMVPGRDLELMYLAARAEGKRLPVSINIGLDPAIYVASACTGPLAPPGFNELGIAGAIRGRAVELARCRTLPSLCIANAEYVIDGEIGHETIPESRNGNKSMPEFLGYDGAPHPALPVIHVRGIYCRRNPIFQTVIGPGLEQSHLLAFGMEAAALDFWRRYVGRCVRNVRAHPGGGGQLLLFIQLQKASEQDDGVVRRGGMAVLGAFRMVKQVVLVDEDVDVFTDADVWWAMSTRLQASRDIVVLANVQGFPLDPSQNKEFHPSLSGIGMTDKAVFDCTVPFNLKERFRRSQFEPVQLELLREMQEKSCT